MTGESPSVVLAGGGTAGHISPLLAIAEAVRRCRPAARLLAVGTASGMETRLVPAAGLELAVIDRVSMPRRPSAALLKLPARLLRAVRQAGRILDAADADVLVGVGGYVCTPFYLAAWRRRIPIVVHEANARAGLANRVGARLAASVAVAFKAAKLPGATWVGMPMRVSIAGLDRSAPGAAAAARAALGLDPAMPTIVVTGGSSGAAAINRTIAAVAADLAGAGVQLLHITGRDKHVLDATGARLSAAGYHQVEYVDSMERAYAAADVLVARAGAATVCEVSAVGLPAVLVPLPHGNGEQALNAAELVSAGGAVLIGDDGFSPQWFRRRVLDLVRDEAALARMSGRAAGLGVRDADMRMAGFVLAAADRDDHRAKNRRPKNTAVGK